MASPSPSIDVLHDDELLLILIRLQPADILRAAIAWCRWRRLAAGCLPRTGLLGYFYEPTPSPPRSLYPFFNEPTPTPPRSVYPSFHPINDSFLRLSLDFVPRINRFSICDSHLGLLVRLPKKIPRPRRFLSEILVVDPANHLSVRIPPPPRDLLLRGEWRVDRHLVGAAVLSRAHPSRLQLEVVCLTMEYSEARLWVLSLSLDGEIDWRVLGRTDVVVKDSDSIESRCVHAAGRLYWHIPKSYGVLALDPSTLVISYVIPPEELNYQRGKRRGRVAYEYRVGETAEKGELCIAVLKSETQKLEVWVREADRWVWEKETSLRQLFDTIPELPSGMKIRISDIDGGGTGKVFISTPGYGRYSIDLETGELNPLVTDDGTELAHPVFAYTLDWPPAFLARDA